jgi:dolichol-phosphate mannosyltransferase
MLQSTLNHLRRLRRRLDDRLGWAARPVQFALIGGSGAVVDLAALNLLLLWLPLGGARALAIWVAMTWNFLLNRRITFAYARRQSALRQYLLFCLSCLFGALLNWTASLALLEGFDVFRRSPSLAAACGIVLAAVFNYFLCWIVAFGREQQLADRESGQPASATCA